MALKPMHEMYASYDLYSMMTNIRRCNKLRQSYKDCRKVFPNDKIGYNYCLEKLQLWQKHCASARDEVITSPAAASMAEKPVS